MNRPRGRPFAPGNTAGRGRPKGSRKKPKSPVKELLDEHAPLLVRKIIVMAMQGNVGAMRILIERIIPARQDASIRMNLPAIRKAQDLDKAAEKVTQGIRRGDITPAEGGRVMNILEMRSKIIEKVQLESRLEKLEEHVAGVKLPRAA